MADEMVGMGKYFANGIPVNKQTLALEVIDRVSKGPNGSIFSSDPHTFTNFRQAQFLPELMDRSRFESWESKGRKDLYTLCNEKAKDILSTHRSAEKRQTVEKELESLVG